MQTNIETIILSNLQTNEEYSRKVLPFLKEEYFLEEGYKSVFETIKTYIDKYNTLPTVQTLEIDLDKQKFSEKTFDDVQKILQQIKQYSEQPDIKWLTDESETFCQDRSLYLAMTEAIAITNGNNKNLSKTAIPKLMEDALSVSFQTKIGHDYKKDAHERFLSYINAPEKVPFLLQSLNDITEGGVERKTLNALLGTTGVGKSMALCNLAADYIKLGYNVLYITLEMAETKIAKRIDANLLDVDMNDLKKQKENQFLSSFQNKVLAKSFGELKVVEYPNGSVHAGHFLNLLKELQLKEKFIPDVIVVDYLNICGSSRVKKTSSSYDYVKSVAEELRALAQKTNTVVWSATQGNRGAIDSTDLSLANTSESMGSTHTFDFFLGLVSTDELYKMGQLLCIQLKNRYADVFKNNKFTIGVDRPKMRFYDLTTQSNYNRAVSPAPTNTASNINQTQKTKYSIKSNN